MNARAAEFKRHLEKTGMIEIFDVIELEEKEKETGFRTRITINDQSLITFVVIADHAFSYAQTYVLKNITSPRKKELILEYINEINSSSKALKFTLQDDELICQIPLICLDNNKFDPETPIFLLQLMINSLEQYYPKFMKIIWS